MDFRTLARGALYHLALPVRLSFWRAHILSRVRDRSLEPCVHLPDDILCALYRNLVWMKPRGEDELMRSCVAIEVIFRMFQGNAFVARFCSENRLPYTLEDAAS